VKSQALYRAAALHEKRKERQCGSGRSDEAPGAYLGWKTSELRLCPRSRQRRVKPAVEPTPPAHYAAASGGYRWRSISRMRECAST
jgi:hypothetical protein